jgi:hypothetical protein
MKKVLKFLPVFLLIAILGASCNLLGGKQEETPVEQPNLTLTALFDTSLNIPPTVTPQLAATSTTAPTVAPSTAVPTSTTAPSATAVPPTAQPAVKQRGGTQMVANYLTTAPVMDGTYAEWVEKTHKYAIPYVVWGGKNWSGVTDLEGAFASAWDSQYLYISVKVTDDVFVQNKSGAKLYLGDSAEVLIDANLLGDFYTTTLDGDDFQFGISPGNPDKGISQEVYLWYPSGSAGTKTSVLDSSMFESSGQIYRVEIGIPWSMLGVTPTNGLRLGFAVSVSDNDNTSADVQQTMISTAQYRNFLNPTTWGELVLVK